MDLKVLFSSLLVLIFLLFSSNDQSCNVAQGKRILSKEEDLELERQLNVLNKPPVKTIQTREGDTFDCVDINKQPTLDHPLLKNHKIQMRPTSWPKMSKPADITSNAQRSASLFEPLNCPKGTVPIRRTRKEDLIRAKSFLQSYPSSIHQFTTDAPGQHAAGRRSTGAAGQIKYFGARGRINIANPTVGSGSQLSTGQIWVEGGPSDHLVTLQAGWAVAPDLLGDNRTRLFAYSNSDVQHEQGCFNLLCDGFVQTSQEVALGQAISPVSVYFGKQYTLMFAIYQDNVTKYWWLTIGENDGRKIVGYWPNYWFPNLTDGAWKVAWGGLVKGAPNGGPSPQMGNGHLPDIGFDRACSVVYLEIVDPTNNWAGADKSQLENFVEGSNQCYDVVDIGDAGKGQGLSFLFGGPGGDNCGP